MALGGGECWCAHAHGSAMQNAIQWHHFLIKFQIISSSNSRWITYFSSGFDLLLAISDCLLAVEEDGLNLMPDNRFATALPLWCMLAFTTLTDSWRCHLSRAVSLAEACHLFTCCQHSSWAWAYYGEAEGAQRRHLIGVRFLAYVAASVLSSGQP